MQQKRATHTQHFSLGNRKSTGMRRIGNSQVLVLSVVLGFLFVAPAASAASIRFRPHTGSPTKGYEGEKRGHRRPWPCCDRCGACTKSIPPQCQCQDLATSCHPLCKNCVQSPLSVEPPVYQCMDRIPNYCKRTCTPKSLLVGA